MSSCLFPFWIGLRVGPWVFLCSVWLFAPLQHPFLLLSQKSVSYIVVCIKYLHFHLRQFLIGLNDLWEHGNVSRWSEWVLDWVLSCTNPTVFFFLLWLAQELKKLNQAERNKRILKIPSSVFALHMNSKFSLAHTSKNFSKCHSYIICPSRR